VDVLSPSGGVTALLGDGEQFGEGPGGALTCELAHEKQFGQPATIVLKTLSGSWWYFCRAVNF
jgi:hypothetical protein